MESKQGLKTTVLSNMMWKFGERIIAQTVAFVVSLVLARILLPSDYGVVAMLNVFIIIANTFATSGIGASLIQKKDADHLDFSSMFYVSIVFSAVLYLILFVAAPYIAEFYHQPLLCSVLRGLALKLPIASITCVQQAYVARHMIFKKFFWATLGGTIVSAVVGIGMAMNGFGAWALVAQQLTNAIIDMTILFLTVNWRPRWEFSFSRAKRLYSYGWKLLLSSLLHNVYVQLKQLFVGRVYTSADLAYMNRGEHFPGLIITNINASLDSVLFPAMSQKQNEPEQLKQVVRRSIKTSSFVIWPLMVGLAVIAEPLIRLLITDKWLPAVPFLRISCLVQAFLPIHTANLQAIKAKGRSDIFLKLEIAKKTFGIAAIIIAVRISVMAVAYAVLIQTIFAAVLNTYPNTKLLGYKYHEQIRDLLPSMSLAAVTGVLVYFMNYIPVPDLLKMIMQVIVGGVVYIGLALMFRIDSIAYILDTVKPYFEKIKRK